MSKKIVIFIICILLVVLIAIVGLNKKNTTSNIAESESKIQYDEETKLYYIKDEETGVIINASREKADLEFYLLNPDYDPNPLAPKKTDLRDFIEYDEFQNIVIEPENIVE